MKYTLILRAEAENEIKLAYNWYETQSKGLGASFIMCIDAAMSIIQRTPQIYPKVYKTLHRALVRRFPYEIFYTVKGSKITILAVFHAKRNPSRWQNRHEHN